MAAFFLVWGNFVQAADDVNPAAVMYFAVPPMGIIGAAMARFRPAGMARALFVTALAQALAKLPADRFDTVREFSESLDRREIPVAPPGVARASAVMFPRWIVWAAALVLVALGAVAMAKWLTRTPVPSTVTRFAVPLPSGYSMLYGQEPDLAISPDGRTLVYRTGGRLFRRVLDSFDAQPIPGTEEAYTPFFSPDGAWLGFVHGSALMKVPVAGGPPVKIADAFVSGGATWSRDGQVIFAGALGNAGLWSVPAAGGTPQQITIVSDSASETNHMWPDLLPDGAVLYTALGPSGHAGDARLIVQDIAHGSRTVVLQGMTYGHAGLRTLRRAGLSLVCGRRGDTPAAAIRLARPAHHRTGARRACRCAPERLGRWCAVRVVADRDARLYHRQRASGERAVGARSSRLAAAALRAAANHRTPRDVTGRTYLRDDHPHGDE